MCCLANVAVCLWLLSFCLMSLVVDHNNFETHRKRVDGDDDDDDTTDDDDKLTTRALSLARSLAAQTHAQTDRHTHALARSHSSH